MADSDFDGSKLDDDDDDDDDELFLRKGWPPKVVKFYFQAGPLPQIRTSTSSTSREGTWTCREPDFFCCTKFYISSNHYTTHMANFFEMYDF